MQTVFKATSLVEMPLSKRRVRKERFFLLPEAAFA